MDKINRKLERPPDHLEMKLHLILPYCSRCIQVSVSLLFKLKLNLIKFHSIKNLQLTFKKTPHDEEQSNNKDLNKHFYGQHSSEFIHKTFFVIDWEETSQFTSFR